MSTCPYCKDKGYAVKDEKIGSTTSINDLVVYCPHCSAGRQLASRAHRSEPENDVRVTSPVVEIRIYVSTVFRPPDAPMTN